MKSHFILIFTLVLLLLSVYNSSAQSTDSLVIKKTIDTGDNPYNKKYTKSIFRFFDMESKQQIKPAGGISINGILILADAVGEIKLYLSKSAYSIQAVAVGWKDSKICKVEIAPQYSYQINIYLTHDREPLY